MGDDLTQADGTHASSSSFAKYDQVHKPAYHLAEAADDADDFDEDFERATCALSQFTHGTPAEHSRFAQELGHALSDVGFAILVGHGIEPEVFDDADRATQELFTSTDEPTRVRHRAARHGAVSEGYFPMKETSDIHPDLVQGWVFGRRAFDLGHRGSETEDYDVEEFWPLPHLEPRFRRWAEAGTGLFPVIMRAVLHYLGCDEDVWSQQLQRPEFGLRLNYYPPLTDADRASGAGRLLGHEDIDLFTLLPAPRVEGLQVLKRDGRWVRVRAPRGSIVVNVGDYLQRISNDVLRSTTHRVSPPRSGEDASRARCSFPLNAYLPADEVLEVLPGLADPRYEPIKVITFHTRTTAKFYGDDYAVEDPVS